MRGTVEKGMREGYCEERDEGGDCGERDEGGLEKGVGIRGGD